MNYEEFKIEYTSILKKMMGYTPNECGSVIFSEKMADLADAYPEFAEMVENE